MKALNKIFVTGAALVLLTGCNLFSGKISKEKFQEKIDKLEEHQYTEVKITEDIDLKGTEDFEDESEKKTITATFTWSEEIGSWTYTDASTMQLGNYIMCLKDTKVEDLEDDSTVPEGIKQTVTYYSNMKVVITLKGTSDTTEDGVNMKLTYNDKYVMKFDKYGYLTSLDANMDQYAEMSYGDMAMKGSIKGTEKVTCEYK